MAITKITTPELFDFSATNTALQLPTGTTAQRPTSPSTGEWRFNTDEKYVEYWDGSAWKQIDTEAGPNPDDFPSQNFNVNTYNGTGATQAIDAKFNEAANFNGASSGSQIFISDADVFSPANNDLSFSVWVKTSSTSGGYFASKQDDSTITYEWQFYMNTNGTVVIGVFTSGGSTIATATSTATVNDGNWHNVAFVIDTNTSITVYVDKAGVTTSSWSGTMSNTSTDVLLGAGGGVPSFRLQGMLDQARFFNTAITQSQIDSLYDSETTTTAATLDFPSGAGCFAAYQLDGDASDVGGTYGGVETSIGYTGLRFQPDFVWIKARSDSKNHVLVDSVRGNREVLEVDLAAAQVTSSVGSDVTGFNSNGFGLGPDQQVYVNPSGTSMVAWCLKAGGNSNTFNVDDTGYSTASAAGLDSGTINPSGASVNTKSGFSIIQYTTSGVQSIAHGLGKEPQLIIQRNISIASYWPTYVSSAASPSMGNGKLLRLNDSPSVATDSFFMSAVGSDTFTTSWSGTSYTYINYCFANIANYQKVGSYTGNGSTSNIISTEITAGDGGFEPAFVIIKAVNSGDNWYMLDNKRLNGGFPYTNVLYPNLPNSELANVGGNGEYSINFLTNGFQLTEITAGYNQSGEEYFYLAIAADKDTSVPTQANSFSPTLYTGTGGTNHNIYTPFAPDFTWIKSRSVASSHGLYDTIRGGEKWITSNGTNSEQDTPTALQKFNPNGFTLGNDSGQWGVNASSATYVSWNWKAGGVPTINNDGTNITSIVTANQAAGFSIVKYKGIGSTASVGHGLGVVPKLIIAKCVDITSAWVVYSVDTGVDKFIELNDSAAAQTASGYWGSSAPTTSVFEVNNGNSNNNSTGNSIIAYCFADISNYQQVGTYAGNLTTPPSITTGFSPRFLMIKKIDNGTGPWVVIDSARASTNPASARLRANAQDTEYSSSAEAIYRSATGFTVGTVGNLNTWDGMNANSTNYLYLAIA